MKPTVGTIPEEIAVVKSAPTKVQVGSPWDYVPGFFDESDEEELGLSRIEVTPAFITDAANAKSIETAKRSAKAIARNIENFTPIVEIKKNTPIKEVQICSLEGRSNNGVNYKVIADGAYVDCREDVIIDAMLQEGIKKGGILGGEYIWVKLGAYSRLIRVGSTLHKKLEIIVNRKQMKVISAKDLVPGKIYATKKDHRALYVGRVNTTYLDFKPNYADPNQSLDFTSSDLKNLLFFIRIPEVGERNIKKFIYDIADKDTWRSLVSWTTLESDKDHKYVAELGKMEYEGIIEMVRNKGREHIKEAVLSLSTGKSKFGYQYTKQQLGYDICRNSKVANMYDVNGDVVPPFDYEQLLNFI